MIFTWTCVYFNTRKEIMRAFNLDGDYKIKSAMTQSNHQMREQAERRYLSMNDKLSPEFRKSLDSITEYNQR